jgi:hypothetical protein
MPVLELDQRHKLIRALADDARQEFIDQLEDFSSPLRRVSDVPYESPIEEAFALAWQAFRMISRSTDLESDGPPMALPAPTPQFGVVCAGRTYRVDFAFAEFRLAVECDGHAFHERTPEQVEQRNTRDADLQSSGWHVLHFSGRQLLRKPSECAQRTHDALCDCWARKCTHA